MKYLLLFLAFFTLFSTHSQVNEDISVDLNTTFQTVEGFGASLAFYENWLTAHPNKNEIYEAIFNELSLDILRVRNAYDYDAEMIGRVVEFYKSAEKSLGKPIKILSTSWGPPAYLKSNNDRKNGGSLKYSVNDKKVTFNYNEFASWWKESLDEYNNNGIYPDYISLQNEPEYKATWESCLFEPSEKINSKDTIAGYNKALEAIYNMVDKREVKPKILGPETIGIGYNKVQNYVSRLNTSYIYGIAHHLYHGVDENNPWISTKFNEVGNYYKDIPYFQTEFGRGDWFSLAGLMYKSFHDENVVAYLYWDLIWTGAGLVDLDFPWDRNRWNTTKGYVKTKTFYAFKQYSAFIHPNWVRVHSSNSNENIKTLAFASPNKDTISLVLVNRSKTENLNVNLSVHDFNVNKSEVFRTSENENCLFLGELEDMNLTLPKTSITSIQLTSGNIANVKGFKDTSHKAILYPNPASKEITIKLPKPSVGYDFVWITDLSGKVLKKHDINSSVNQTQNLTIDCSEFSSGLYFYKITSAKRKNLMGKFLIKRH